MAVKKHRRQSFPAGLRANCLDRYVSENKMSHLSKGTWRGCAFLMESSGIKPVAARQAINSTDSMHYAWFNRTFTLKIKAITVARSLLANFWGLSSKTLIRNVSAELIKWLIQHLSTSTNVCTSGWIRTIWTDNLFWLLFGGLCVHILTYGCVLCILPIFFCI